METWHIWIIIALLLFIIEIFTSGFAIFCISVGAIAAAIASELDMELKGSTDMLLYRNICIVCCRAAADDKIFPQKKQTGTDQHECINWQNGNRHGDNRRWP